MPSNLTPPLSADEIDRWERKHGEATAMIAAEMAAVVQWHGRTGDMSYSHVLMSGGELSDELRAVAKFCEQWADAAILALRERCAAEPDRVAAEPPLTPERAREVMAEYVAKGTWKNWTEDGWASEPGHAVDIDKGKVTATLDGWNRSVTITTESALRAFCDGAGEGGA